MKIINKKINNLKESEYNPRQLTEKQFKDLKNSINEFGVIDPIIINANPERKDVIIGGHQRVKVAKTLGIETVPCVALELSLDDEKKLNVRLNKNNGEWDWDILANNFNVDDLVEWGFDEKELGWNDAPTNDDWASYFEEKGDTSGVDGRHQITFVLNAEELELLQTKLNTLDKNKNKAIMLLINK
tara:strand:- start:5510 stop:6067 length:558 start_codon:yes stop_codon:yes gene_type:complete